MYQQPKFTEQEKLQLVFFIMECGLKGDFSLSFDEWLDNKRYTKIIDRFYKEVKYANQ